MQPSPQPISSASAQFSIKSLPFALVVMRLLIAPCLVWDALDRNISVWFLIGFIAAFLSDIFDGMIARRLGVSTMQLRQADSWADVALYSGIAASAWLVYPQVLIDFRLPLLTVMAVQVLLFSLSWLKFGKTPSYHTYSAKVWGLTLFAATVALFGFNDAGLALWSAIALGLINSLEEIIMTLVLPTWTHDVLSIVHALKIRRDYSATVS
ncbi:MAG: CDP-alcohol phosphatidyltransferase family protein [Trichocoleus desertorum ATA4-8-CV12]|jgi:CDP-diacylglycerol--glycerol-3-phosphate 3-phosphatidyltransferase|nr:CDP-alcohol phosphatidyltransferase family protein [Trichocoleus desertorum ATA4-8-CV12]